MTTMTTLAVVAIMACFVLINGYMVYKMERDNVAMLSRRLSELERQASEATSDPDATQMLSQRLSELERQASEATSDLETARMIELEFRLHLQNHASLTPGFNTKSQANPINLSLCRVLDTLPPCQAAFQRSFDEGFTASSSAGGQRVVNSAVLFFCPCATEVLRERLHSEHMGGKTVDYLPRGTPRSVGENVWKTLSAALDPGHDKIAVQLLLASKRYLSKTGSHDYWSTAKDEGASFVMKEQQESSGYTAYFATAKIKPGELTLDIGSNLGIISVMAAERVPEAYILSVEAMPFTWMYQQINTWLNLPLDYMLSDRLMSALAALGETDGEKRVLQFRDDSLTSTRDWNPDNERGRTLCNVTVALVTLPTLLRRYKMEQTQISWFKLDCEGCEYDIIPAMTEDEWRSIRSMSGELHFDDMAHWNPAFLPDPAKVDVTHRRVCQYMKDIRECKPGYHFRRKYTPASKYYAQVSAGGQM